MKRKYPYAYTNEKGKDIFVFIGIDEEVREKVIPKQGTARYFFDKGDFGEVEYMFNNEARQTAQFNAILYEDLRQKKREKYFAKSESKYITENRAEINNMEK